MKQLVIMPGGFHPFHAGHAALYNSAREAFPNADVYVAATNDTSTRPFPFAVKEKLAQLAGVSKGRFMQVKSPFRAEEITSRYDPDTTQLIFVRSQKDAGSPPRPGGTKKDGTPSYLQPYNDTSDQPLSQRAYMAYLPTVEFGPGMTSATEIRTAWPQLNEKRKTALVMSLYPKTQTNPKLAATVVKLLDTAMGTELNEFAPSSGNGGDEKSYLLQLADDLGNALYGPNKNKQEIENIMGKIRAAGGDVKISWNNDSTMNVVMYHPVHFKQGYLIRLVGRGEQGVAEDTEQQWTVTVGTKTGGTSHTMTFTGTKEQAIKKAVARFGTSKNPVVKAVPAKQRVAETINSAILNTRFKHKQVIGDYTYTATAEDFEGAPLLWIKAYDGNKEIGHILFEIIVRSPGGRRMPSADYLESGGTEVDPAYRNKGIASTMYAYAKMLGNDIRASYNQTSQGKAMWAAWEKAGDAKHLVGTAAESAISEDLHEGPFVQRIMHPSKVSIYLRSGKVPKLVATNIPYEILDKYIAKVIAKYPQFKPSDFSFESSDKVSENQGWAATYEGLKPDAFNALQQAKQNIEQQRQQEISQWEQDFRANSAKLAGQQPKQRFNPPAVPVAQPGEKHSILKARIAQLDQAIKKQQQLDALSQKLEHKGLLTPAMQQDFDTRLLVRGAAADNYQALNQKLDRAIEIAVNRLRTNKLAFRENADYIDEAKKQ
jgi:GNAT superfamily N-acetyltransferase